MGEMGKGACTIITIPRDRFCLSEASYESIAANNPADYPIIYVDSCNPKPWADRLDALAAEGKITLIRSGFHLSQNEAYNLAIPHVRSEYILFVDNDVLVTPGWAENLLACAEETGASAVTTLVEEKEPGQEWRVHMCGGDCGVEERDGQLGYKEVHPHHRELTRDDLTRCPTGLLEYHAWLIRRDMLEKLGPFDEGFWHALNHADTSLQIRAAGGTIWIEPAARVQFQLPPPLDLADLGFFINRWSNRRVAEGIRHFSEKWSVHVFPDLKGWFHYYRLRIQSPLRPAMTRWFGSLGGKIAWRILWPLEPVFSRMVEFWSRVPDRARRLEALGIWRGPQLDRKYMKTLSEKIFRHPRPLERQLPAV